MTPMIHVLHLLSSLDGGAARQVSELSAILTKKDFRFTVLPYQEWRQIPSLKPDIVHTHGKGAGLFGRLIARARGIPAVHTLHGFHWERYGPWYILGERILARGSRIIHVSESEKKECHSCGITMGVVIPNGVVAGPPTWKYEGPPLLGTVARDDPIKRLSELRRMCQRVGIPLVVGTGPGIPPCTIYVSWSQKEGCPYGMLDAMRASLPIIASDIPAHRELIDSYLAASPEHFISQLHTLVESAWVCRIFGDANYERVAKFFTAQRMADKTADVYSQCLNGG